MIGKWVTIEIIGYFGVGGVDMRVDGCEEHECKEEYFHVHFMNMYMLYLTIIYK